MYAIVDIETTGGNSQRDKITEIAIYIHDGEKIVDEFITLVNPERSIPYYITQMTGISDEMVAGAPRFFEIAKKIVEVTEGKIFVAHNAQFDYRFIQNEFKQLGYSYIRDTLCTVRLSRKLIPGKSSYSLGTLCNELGIEIKDRHRASGDALATVKLLDILLASRAIATEDFFNPIPDRKGLHPDLDLSKLAKIPDDTGVYFFYDEKGVLIYVGKSINIRTRILQHLGKPKSNRASEMRSRIADISYDVTGSELIALLLETQQIKMNKPVFNRMGRRSLNRYGLFPFQNEMDYLCLQIAKLSDNKEIPVTSFSNLNEAKSFIESIMDRYDLCQKYCGLYSTSGACFRYQINKCQGACIGEESSVKYNIRVNRALDSICLNSKSFMLFDIGRRTDEKSVVKVENGKLIGYGYFDPVSIDGDLSLINDMLIPCRDNHDTHQIIRSYLSKAKPSNVLYFKSDQINNPDD